MIAIKGYTAGLVLRINRLKMNMLIVLNSLHQLKVIIKDLAI